MPDWVADAIAALDADAILVTPHWEWNMTAEPVAHVRAAARGLLEAGATLVAGHSAHVFHGIALRVLCDLGDSSTTTASTGSRATTSASSSSSILANSRLEAIPLKLEFAHTLRRR